MGIFGSIKLKRREVRVVIGLTAEGEEFALVLRAPRLQVMDEIAEQLPAPTPPIMRDEHGPRARRNEDGTFMLALGQKVFERNPNDPAYKQKVKVHQRAQTIALLYAMAADQIEPPVELKDDDWSAFYIAIWESFEEAGVGIDSMKALNTAAETLLSPMSPEEVEIARKVLGSDKETGDAIAAELEAKGKPTPQGK